MGKKWEPKQYDGKGSFSKLNPTALAINAEKAVGIIGKEDEPVGPPFEKLVEEK